jgi:hypothetical protein
MLCKYFIKLCIEARNLTRGKLSSGHWDWSQLHEIRHCYPVGDRIMRCGYRSLKVDHGKRFSTGKAYIIAWKASGTMPKNV